jgi:hypothetical protein
MGADASFMPFFANDMPGIWTGEEDDFGLVGEVGFWTHLRTTETLDYRLRLSFTSTFPMHGDEDTQRYYSPGASFEAKFSNDSGTAALILGGSAWMIFSNLFCD